MRLAPLLALSLLGCAARPVGSRSRAHERVDPPPAWTRAPVPSGRVSSIAIRPPSAAPPRRIRFDRPSPFGRVLVVDEGERRHLRFGSPDGDDQTVVSLRDAGAAPMDCVRHMLLGALLVDRFFSKPGPPATRALLVGLGGGAISSLLMRAFPALHVDAVEINPVVVEAARRFFGVRRSGRMEIHVADGAAFIGEAAVGAYDLIVLDAYDAEVEPPPQLTTRAFYESTRKRLAPGGAVVINLSLPPAAERSVEQRFRPVFGHCACILGHGGTNQVVICTRQGPLPTRTQLARRAQQVGGLSVPLEQLVRRLRLDASCRVGRFCVD